MKWVRQMDPEMKERILLGAELLLLEQSNVRKVARRLGCSKVPYTRICRNVCLTSTCNCSSRCRLFFKPISRKNICAAVKLPKGNT